MNSLLLSWHFRAFSYFGRGTASHIRSLSVQNLSNWHNLYHVLVSFPSLTRLQIIHSGGCAINQGWKWPFAELIDYYNSLRSLDFGNLSDTTACLGSQSSLDFRPLHSLEHISMPCLAARDETPVNWKFPTSLRSIRFLNFTSESTWSNTAYRKISALNYLGHDRRNVAPGLEKIIVHTRSNLGICQRMLLMSIRGAFRDEGLVLDLRFSECPEYEWIG